MVDYVWMAPKERSAFLLTGAYSWMSLILFCPIVIISWLTDRGTEYCGKQEHHEYQLYLGIENIDHSKTKARSPQSNGICERFHKTVLDEFYRIAFRRKIYNNLDDLQADLDT
jgi:transposase InsO family protein